MKNWEQKKLTQIKQWSGVNASTNINVFFLRSEFTKRDDEQKLSFNFVLQFLVISRIQNSPNSIPLPSRAPSPHHSSSKCRNAPFIRSHPNVSNDVFSRSVSGKISFVLNTERAKFQSDAMKRNLHRFSENFPKQNYGTFYAHFGAVLLCDKQDSTEKWAAH